jgi:hypothetical protein
LVVGLDMIWSKKQMGKVRTAEMMVVRDQEWKSCVHAHKARTFHGR